MAETVTSKDDTRIAFDRIGDGPPVLLIGGALSDRTAATELSEALAPDLTVIAYDRRGRGDSGDTRPYAVEREVDDAAALVEAADGSASVFGHSSGAVLALELARAHPDAIAKLALYEPPFIVDDSRPPLPDDYVEHLDRLVAAGRRGDAVAYFLTLGPGVPEEQVEGMRGQPFWARMESVAHTIAYDGRIMGDTTSGSPEPLERWASGTTPALVMDGGASPPWQRHGVLALAEVLPNVEHRTLEGQTHGAATDVLAPVLVDFFRT
jgi:pimeloyl-ACP methyl ester carboxylesterase